MNFPTDLKYTKDHEWARIETQGDKKIATVGITEHAQKALGDIVYTDLPAVGRDLKQGETFGVVESIKAVSDLFAPVTGKVTAVNTALKDNPEIINQDSHGKAWMIKVEITDPGTLNELMDAASYTKYVDTLGH